MALDLVQVKVEVESDDENEENVRNSVSEMETQPSVAEPVFIAIKQEIPEEINESASPEVAEPDSTTPDEAYEVHVKQEPLEHVEAVLEESCSTNFVFPPPQSQLSNPDYDIDSMIDNSNNRYQCRICLKVLSSKYNAQRHVLFHKRTQGHCEICNIGFIDLARHKKTQHRSYPCRQCEKSFNTPSHLLQHERTHLTLKPYQCSFCSKTFTTKANVRKHEGKSRCRPDENLTCHVCLKEFKYLHLLKSHLTSHTTERPYECHFCGMRFKHKSTIIRHLLLHNTEKQYPCNVCGKKFATPGLIKPHMRMHTGEKPFQCDVCNKKFAHKHNMERHRILHDKIVHLVCQICNKKFPRESRLKYHMRTHVPDRVVKLPFKCEYCHKRYSHRQNIIRHYKKKHPTKTYTHSETDASIAAKIWETMQKKIETKNECILPDIKVQTDVNNEIVG